MKMLYTLESINPNGGTSSATVFCTLADDSVPEGIFIPSITVEVPVTLHGQSVSQIEKTVIELVRRTVQPDALEQWLQGLQAAGA